MKTKTGKSFFFLSSFFLCSILVVFPSAQAADESGIKLTAGQQLMKGQSITLLDGELILQNDSNLVFYVNTTPYWATNTHIKRVTHAIMQQDGNLVLYNNSMPVWSSDTWNVGAQGGYLYCDIATRSVGTYSYRACDPDRKGRVPSKEANQQNWCRARKAGGGYQEEVRRWRKYQSFRDLHWPFVWIH
jgi:hypothetical protein